MEGKIPPQRNKHHQSPTQRMSSIYTKVINKNEQIKIKYENKFDKYINKWMHFKFNYEIVLFIFPEFYIFSLSAPFVSIKLFDNKSLIGWRREEHYTSKCMRFEWRYRPIYREPCGSAEYNLEPCRDIALVPMLEASLHKYLCE